MPTYDYRCKKCSHTWEQFQSIKAEPIKKCPECGKNQAERVIGPGAAILFKGSGFYLTDYRSDSYKKAAAADKPASAASSESKSNSSGNGSTSDSKAASKNE
ncbi:FmdB family transcriptional regulator [Planctomyces sp. SCGC AG-212-M04]|nr:FmdB family transcriptional regulator [Planctomyces sp. SCGC AG-212-M04]